MKTWLLWLSVGIAILAVGCTTTPTDSTAHEHNFASMSAEGRGAVTPLPLGARPRAMAVHTEGGTLLCFDESNAMQLLAGREAAETNQRIATELSRAVEKFRDERGALIDAGRACEVRANLLKAALEAERAQHAQDNFLHRIGLGALLLALIL